MGIVGLYHRLVIIFSRPTRSEACSGVVAAVASRQGWHLNSGLYDLLLSSVTGEISLYPLFYLQDVSEGYWTNLGIDIASSGGDVSEPILYVSNIVQGSPCEGRLRYDKSLWHHSNIHVCLCLLRCSLHLRLWLCSAHLGTQNETGGGRLKLPMHIVVGLPKLEDYSKPNLQIKCSNDDRSKLSVYLWFATKKTTNISNVLVIGGRC